MESSHERSTAVAPTFQPPPNPLRLFFVPTLPLPLPLTASPNQHLPHLVLPGIRMLLEEDAIQHRKDERNRRDRQTGESAAAMPVAQQAAARQAGSASAQEAAALHAVAVPSAVAAQQQQQHRCVSSIC